MRFCLVALLLLLVRYRREDLVLRGGVSRITENVEIYTYDPLCMRRTRYGLGRWLNRDATGFYLVSRLLLLVRYRWEDLVLRGRVSTIAESIEAYTYDPLCMRWKRSGRGWRRNSCRVVPVLRLLVLV